MITAEQHKEYIDKLKSVNETGEKQLSKVLKDLKAKDVLKNKGKNIFLAKLMKTMRPSFGQSAKVGSELLKAKQ